MMDIHLNGQVVQTLVVLFLLDRAVFEEGCQQCHLPVVKDPALFLWGQVFPYCLVRRVHRATVLTAFSIVSHGRVGFKIGLETIQIFYKCARSPATDTPRDRPKSVDISGIFAGY